METVFVRFVSVVGICPSLDRQKATAGRDNRSVRHRCRCGPTTTTGNRLGEEKGHDIVLVKDRHLGESIRYNNSFARLFLLCESTT